MSARSRLRLAAFVLVAAAAPVVHAQQPARPRPSRPAQAMDPARLGPGEVQRLFDAYMLMQAQDALNLTDAQYASFVARLKALQDVRHRNRQARAEILRDLGQLANQGTADEGALSQRLKALRDQDAKDAAEIQKAYASIDEVLDVRQQARFRLFEDNMEGKKLDLLMRARQRRGALSSRQPRRP